MAKKNVVFFCKECGNETNKWMGNCPACGEWNTIVEQPKQAEPAQGISRKAVTDKRARPQGLDEIEEQSNLRIQTGIGEFDRVLGGGLVNGSFVLLGGDPGIGKSTIMLQMARTAAHLRVLYCSGEESARQIKQRAERLQVFSPELKIYAETDINAVIEVCKKENPDVMIIDSIQTIYRPELSGAPGSPSQVRECAMLLLNLAKSLPVTVIAVGHVTKEGELAGPRMLEHMVDTVLQFEGDQSYQFRILRTLKNRFGRTNEIGVFEMTETGLREEPNPSRLFLREQAAGEPGSAVTCMLEGSRPLLLEVQALVTKSYYGIPQRTSNGFDSKRLALLLAVLEKRCGVQLGDKDVFVNIAGGMKLREPAADLAVVTAVLSSYHDVPVKGKSAFIGEVGLSAELRSVSRLGERIQECVKMGFDKVFMPKSKLEHPYKKHTVELEGIQRLVDALKK